MIPQNKLPDSEIISSVANLRNNTNLISGLAFLATKEEQLFVMVVKLHWRVVYIFLRQNQTIERGARIEFEKFGPFFDTATMRDNGFYTTGHGVDFLSNHLTN